MSGEEKAAVNLEIALHIPSGLIGGGKIKVVGRPNTFTADNCEFFRVNASDPADRSVSLKNAFSRYHSVPIYYVRPGAQWIIERVRSGLSKSGYSSPATKRNDDEKLGPSDSVEVRLEKLSDLLKRGLISEEEAAEKRRDILEYL